MSLNIFPVELPVEREVISQAAAKVMLGALEELLADAQTLDSAIRADSTSYDATGVLVTTRSMERTARAAIHAATAIEHTHTVEHVLTVHVDVDSDGTTEVVDVKTADGADWDGELTADERERVQVEAYDAWRERGDPSHVYEMREKAGVGR